MDVMETTAAGWHDVALSLMETINANQTEGSVVDSDPEYLPHPLERDRAGAPKALTYVEQYQRRFSASFRNHWNWTVKLKDRAYITELLRDAQERDRYLRGGRVLTWRKEDINMVYDDLIKSYEPYVRALREQEIFIEPDIDCVWREDDFLDDDGLRGKLIAAVDTLETTPNSRVADLVDPYNWPIVYGRSVSNDGFLIKRPYPPNSKWSGYSRNFCWLPSEFEVSSDGKNTRIASYINNLALMHQERLFYPILENIFTYFVPMFDRTLADLRAGRYGRRRVRSPPPEPESWKIPIKIHNIRWERLLKQFEENEKLEEDFDSDSSNEVTEAEDIDEDDEPPIQNRRSRNLQPPRQSKVKVMELAAYRRRKRDRRWEPPKLSESTSLKGQTAKVVVRMMNITLSPQDPDLLGTGSWITEGLLNERIVATGIYCYSQKNIKNPRIVFGIRVSENHQNRGWGLVHNMSAGAEIQEIGSTPLKDNRAITFPNMLRYQFDIAIRDPNKPGYCKFLIFSICDPNRSIPTTRTVGPQQPDVRQQIDDVLSMRLPRELTAMILEYLPPAISNSDASIFKEKFVSDHFSPDWSRWYQTQRKVESRDQIKQVTKHFSDIDLTDDELIENDLLMSADY